MLTRWFVTRVGKEQKIMRNELPQFRLYRLNDEIFFQGWHTTTTSQKQFKLKLPLPKGYPDTLPYLYITYPLILPKYGGGTINELVGASHAFHTLGQGPGGCVSICHFNSASWDASKTCVGILFKGMLWCEAYAVHLRTGLNISEIIDNWRRISRLWKENKIQLKDSLARWPEVGTWETSWATTGAQRLFDAVLPLTPITSQKQFPKTTLSILGDEDDSYFRGLLKDFS